MGETIEVPHKFTNEYRNGSQSYTEFQEIFSSYKEIKFRKI